MKILFFNATSEIGGADRSLLVLLRHLPKAYDKVVVLPALGPWSEEFAGVARVLYVPLRKLKRTRNPLWHLRWLITAPLRVARYVWLINREKPDVIHLNASILILPGLAAWVCGKPLVWHVREIGLKPFWAARIIRGFILLVADKIVCISRAVAEEFPKTAQISVIYNGVEPMTKPLLERENRQSIGVIGRFVPFKGIENASEAVARAREKLPTLRLRIAGGPVPGHEAYAERLRATVESRLTVNNVEWSGWVKDIGEWFSNVDLLLHLPQDPEPLGRVIVEAGLGGIPAIAFATGGLPETIRDGETGYLVAWGDFATAADRIVELLSDEEKRRRFGKAAEAFARERFAPSKYASDVARLYEGLMTR